MLYRYFTGLPASGYEWAYGERAAAGLIPTNDATCVFVGTTSAHMHSLRRNGAEHAFATLLAMAAPAFIDRIADAKPATSLRGWGGVPGYLRRGWGDGWALVGDAGYFKDPITTHGMTDAMRDAELLANAVLATLSGCDPATAFTAYEGTRDRLSRDMFDVTEAVAAYDWNLDKLRHLLRDVSAAMADEVDHLQWERAGARSAGYWVPAAQVPDGLAVLPLDRVFEQMGQLPAAGDAGDVGDPAAGPDRDDEPLVVEGERLQRPALELRVQVAGHRLALLQRHLRQRGQHVPAARIHHRGKVAGDVDLRMVQHAQVPVDLDAAIVAGR